MKTYIVTYVNKYNHKEHVHEMRVQAKNLKDAREQFEHKYYDPKKVGNPRHPFRIQIKLCKDSEPLELTKRFFVRFNNPVLNAWWEFQRGESGAFAYGNQTSVKVFRDDNFISIVDTRYDHSVMGDFGAWCRNYLLNYLDPAYEPQIEEH